MNRQGAVPSAHPRDRLPRSLGLVDATLLVVASVIGAGIFFAPGTVADRLPDPKWIIFAWFLGALISLGGALANAELGAMFPRAGGDYVYLREAFHPLAGFLVGWLSFFAIYAGTVATLAFAFSNGLLALIGPDDAGEGASLVLAVVVTLTVSAVNYVGVRWGALANGATSLMKVAGLLLFVITGFAYGEGDLGRLSGGGLAGEVSLTSLGLAMSPILFSYLGWNASVYVASEIRSPERNLPRSCLLGLGICAVVYMLVNALYLYSMPLSDFRGVSDAGKAAALALFGPRGGTYAAIFVLASILGTLNAMILVGPRIAYAMSLDDLFFSGVDRVHKLFRTPSTAIVVQAFAAIGLLGVLRTFPSALDYTVFAILVATLADVAALYRLRISQPNRTRPYRAWGYPVIPALYLLANAAIAVTMLLERSFECAVGLGMLAAGLPFYFWFTRRGGGAPAPLRSQTKS